MEAQTGVTLVRRTPRGSSLTAEGAVIDLRRSLRVIWAGAANPPAGAARDLIAHILSRRVPGPGTARGEGERPRPR